MFKCYLKIYKMKFGFGLGIEKKTISGVVIFLPVQI